jgi:hypothetical protein
MRKGFTLTLTTLAVALLATSVYAYGPTVGAVPDVWITEKTDTGTADGPQYLFRYSDAILLNDFVTPGVATGDGSASDTLYWGWALRQSNGTAGYGAFLSGTDVHYNAIGDDDADVLPGTPTFTPSGDSFSAGWEAEVNGWAGKPTLADSGSLTFRNIRLNPTLAENASPTSDSTNAQLPAGYLDAQEATVFVTDNATSPAFDTFQLITLLSTATVDRDTLSGGGPSFEVVEDYRSSTPSSAWTLLGVGVSVHNGTGGPGPTSYVNNGTGTLTATFPLVNNKGTDTTDPYFPASIFFKAGVNVTSDKVYRLTARVASNNTVATKNPSVAVSLNGRTSVGQAQNEASSKPALADLTVSPVSGTPIYLKAFLWPAANGSLMSWYVIWDNTDAIEGTITMDQMLLESFDPTLLAGENVLAEYGTGATAFSGFITGELVFYNPSGTTDMNVTVTAAANTISFTGQAGTSTATDGAGYALHPTALFTTSASSGKKLVAVKVSTKTTSSDTAKVPDFVYAVNSVPGNYRSTFFIDRLFSGATVQNPDADVSATARDYICMFESDPSTAYDISMFAVVGFDDATNGNITVEKITAVEYDLPSETTVLP